MGEGSQKGCARDGRRGIIYGRRDCKGKRRENKENLVEKNNQSDTCVYTGEKKKERKTSQNWLLLLPKIDRLDTRKANRGDMTDNSNQSASTVCSGKRWRKN